MSVVLVAQQSSDTGMLREVLDRIWTFLLDHPLPIIGIVSAWIVAEIVWLAIHPNQDRPRVEKKIASGSAAAIKKAPKKKAKGHDNRWPLPGGVSVLSEFLVIIGGSGTGKTLRILLYILAYRLKQAKRSLIVLDPKGELWKWIYRLLDKFSGYQEIHLISTLKRHKDRQVSAINPLMDADEALSFLKTAIPGEDKTKDSFFDNAGQRMVFRVTKALIVEWDGTDLVQVYLALDDPDELDRLAKRHTGVRAVWRGSKNPRGADKEARETALTALSALDVPRIRRIFDTKGAWQASPTFAGLTAAFLTVSAKDAKMAPGLVRAAVDHLLIRAGEGHTELGGPKVDAILEEAGTFGPLEELQVYMNLLRGYGVNIVVVLQAVEQLWARLGRDYASAALSAGGCFVVGQMSSVPSSEWVESMAGKTRVRPPRRYVPLFALLIEAIFSGFSDEKNSTNDPRHDDRVLVPRFPAQCVRAFEHDPDAVENPLLRLLAELKLKVTSRFVMRAGQYLVLARGEQPYLLDTRRHKQIFPAYAKRVLPKQPDRTQLKAAPHRSQELPGQQVPRKEVRSSEGSRRGRNRREKEIPGEHPRGRASGRNCPECWRPILAGQGVCPRCDRAAG